MKEDLINSLIKDHILRSPRIIQAFRKIDRADFVLPEDKYRAYENYPLSIGYNQTISQPLTVAFMLELLQPQAGDKVLDVGAGSGWQTALLAEIVGEQGKVYAIERLAGLCEFGKTNLAKYNFIQRKHVEFLCEDGSKGLPDKAPFDKMIAAAAASAVPFAFKQQLKIGGRLVLPIGDQYDQSVIKIEKVAEGKFKEEKYPGFVFVPLVSED